jgi:hypothetical protein
MKRDFDTSSAFRVARQKSRHATSRVIKNKLELFNRWINKSTTSQYVKNRMKIPKRKKKLTRLKKFVQFRIFIIKPTQNSITCPPEKYTPPNLGNNSYTPSKTTKPGAGIQFALLLVLACRKNSPSPAGQNCYRRRWCCRSNVCSDNCQGNHNKQAAMTISAVPFPKISSYWFRELRPGVDCNACNQ